jgi:hypothetical protein
MVCISLKRIPLYQNHDDIAQARNLRRVSNGFAFEIQNCNKDNNSVVCTFMVANLGEVRDLYFSPTDSIIIDSTGKQLYGSRCIIGAIGLGDQAYMRERKNSLGRKFARKNRLSAISRF